MATIKLALSGDSHRNLKRRLAESHRIHRAMLEAWKERNVDFIGFAGDFNEGQQDEQDVLNNQAYLKSCAETAPIVMCRGNHDVEASLSAYDSRNWPLANAYPIIAEERAGVHVVETKNGPLAVVGVSFPQKQHLIAMAGEDVDLEDIDRIASEQLRNVFLGLGARVQELGLPTVALIHGTVTGAKFNDARPPTTEGITLGLHDIGLIGADITVVGHYHMGQDWQVDWRPIIIPGSPFRTNHGELDEKSWVYAEIDSKTRKVKWERVATPCQPMIHLEADYSRSVGGLVYRNLNGYDPQNADIRLRYHFDKEDADAAKLAALTQEKHLLNEGAEAVKLEPLANPSSTVRDSEIIKATTLQEKLEKLWEARGAVPSRLGSLCLCVDQLLSECGFSQRLNLDAAVRIKTVKLKGWRCFPKIELALDGIGGDVVAIHGRNGVGKSLLFEIAIPGAMYREVPTHGRIGDHVVSKSCFVETEFAYDGKDYVVKQLLNHSGGGSASLTVDGKSVLKSALRKEYDAWTVDNLPPFSLFTSTTFAPQESSGILGMGKSERKALILRAKGVERYEVLADGARKHANAVSVDLERARGRLAELGEGSNIYSIQSEIAKAEAEQFNVEKDIDKRVQVLILAREEAVLIEQRRLERSALIRRQSELEDQGRRLCRQIEDVETKIELNSAVVGEAKEIRDAYERSVNCESELKELFEQERGGLAEISRVDSGLAAAESRANSLRTEQRSLNSEVARLNVLLLDNKELVLGAAARLVDAEKSYVKAQKAETKAREVLSLLRDEVVVGFGERVMGLRNGLIRIFSGLVEPVREAGNAIDEDDRLAAAASTYPQRLEQAKSDLWNAEAASKGCGRDLDKLSLLAQRRGEIDAAEESRVMALGKLEVCCELIVSAEKGVEFAAALRSALREKVQVLQARIATVKDEQGFLKPLADKIRLLESAEANIAAFTSQKEGLEAELQLVSVQTAEIFIPDAEPPVYDVERLEGELGVVHRELTAAHSRLAVLQQRLEQEQATERRRTELTASAKGLSDSLSDWTRLAQDLGRDGLQAEEVANAAVEINDLANDFLRSSGDTQYTVELSTTQFTKDGKREIEGCPINVYNSETGQWQPGETLSPGQRAFVNLALSLTLAIIGCRGSKTKPTIFLDEPTAGLSPDKREPYLNMLREAVKRVGAKLFFVAHTRDLIEGADSRIEVLDGQVEVS